MVFRVYLVAVFASGCVAAQWLHQNAVGIPRTSDGQPNLTAPTPRGADDRPDLSGVWNRSAGQYAADIAAGLDPSKMQPWVRDLYQERLDRYAKDNMGVQCLPEGPRYATRSGFMKILHTPALIAILHEDLTYRQIFLDGRNLPEDPQPSFMGYSVGKWDGDVLVVTTSGFDARTWLDGTGHAHSEALRLVERYRRRDFGHLSVDVTLEDPKAYTEPWTIHVDATLQPDTDLLEFVCRESDGGKSHFVGDFKKDQPSEFKVDPAVLAQYTGSYDITIDGAKLVVEVTLADGKLFINRGGRGARAMVALSESTFTSSMGTYEFQKNSAGEVAFIIYRQVETDIRGPRHKAVPK